MFDPPPFSPDKLRVEYLPGAEDRHVFVRRYTLTHNDLTGMLQLSIGAAGGRRVAGSGVGRSRRRVGVQRAVCAG